MECDFYILNVFNVNSYSLDNMMVPEPGERHYEQAKLVSENGLEKVIGALNSRNENSKHDFFAISTYNGLIEAISHSVKKKNIDMVVMGTKGVTHSNEIQFGSNAILVLEHINSCPVLVIPVNAHLKPIAEIVFPTSYKHRHRRKELRQLVEFAKIFKSAIRVLHIKVKGSLSQMQLENKETLKLYFDGKNHSFHMLTNTGVAKGISCFVESRNSDMIGLFNRKKDYMKTLLNKTNAKEMGYYAKVPLLVLHEIETL
jgi:hypothetical protein